MIISPATTKQWQQHTHRFYSKIIFSLHHILYLRKRSWGPPLLGNVYVCRMTRALPSPFPNRFSLLQLQLWKVFPCCSHFSSWSLVPQTHCLITPLLQLQKSKEGKVTPTTTGGFRRRRICICWYWLSRVWRELFKNEYYKCHSDPDKRFSETEKRYRILKFYKINWKGVGIARYTFRSERASARMSSQYRTNTRDWSPWLNVPVLVFYCCL